MQDARVAETEQSLVPIRPQHQQRQRQNQQFKGEENFDFCVDRKTGWRYYREPRKSGRLRSGKQVGAHGNLHHLRNGGDFGFLGRIPENRRCRQDTHKQCTYCAVQSLHKRRTHGTRLAQDLQRHLCAPEKNLSSGPHMSHPLLLSHMPCTTSTFSSSFKLPSTTTPEHTIGTTRSTPRTHSASSTSPRTTSRKATPSRTTLSVKNSRVAETRATHTPQFWDGRPKAPKGTDKHTW